MSTALSPQASAYAHAVESLGAQSDLDPVSELRYGAHPSQALDVYTPADTGAPLPVLVFFHGGAWINGGREWLRFMAPAVLQLPAVFVAGTYRLAPGHRWPCQYEDVCEAIRLVHARVSDFGGDPDNMVIGGHSSGGHLASMAALRGNLPRLRACFPVSSAFNLEYGRVVDDSPQARIYKYLLKDPADDSDASPVNFVEGNRTPFHIVWGEQDFERILDAALPMVRALEAQGTVVTHEQVRGAGHFDTHLALRDPSNHWYHRLKEIMQTC